MPLKFKCPICGKGVDASDANMPFCSDRCRLLDLGNWASEKYAIPGDLKSEFDDAEEPGSPEGPGR